MLDDSTIFISLISDQCKRDDSQINLNSALEYLSNSFYSQEEMNLKFDAFSFVSRSSMVVKCKVEICFKNDCPKTTACT